MIIKFSGTIVAFSNVFRLSKNTKPISFMKKNLLSQLLSTIIPSLIFLIIFSCSEDSNPVRVIDDNFSIEFLGLEGPRINNLIKKDDKLYACASNGFYVKDLKSKEKFKNIALKGKNIEDAVVFSDQEILISYRNIDPKINASPQLWITKDGGLTWQILENNFGGEETEELVDFERHPTQENIIYGFGRMVLAQSTDKGKTWIPIWGNWQSFANFGKVFVNPVKPNEIWLGGQGALENGYLAHIKDETLVNEWYDLVPNPTVVKKVIFDKLSPQTIYVGWEGELSKSTDNGNTWETLIERHEESHFFMGIGLSDQDPKLVYASKWIKTPDKQDLELYYSKDQGKTWTTKKFPGVDYGGVFDMIVVTENETDRIFVALEKGGVYEIKAKGLLF